MNLIGKFTFCLLMVISVQNLTAQTTGSLSEKQKGMIAIAALTAKGNLPGLKTAIHDGLNAGLTINQVKEMMLHLYAYCGFPRSLNGINTLMFALEERKGKGVVDALGKPAVKVNSDADKYDIGKKNLEALSGRAEMSPKTGYAEFVPAIDTLLKEHLFTDIFGRGVLTNQERELITVSALVSLGNVDAQLSGHFVIAIYNGLSEAQLKDMLAIQEEKIGKNEADAGRLVLISVIKRTK